MKNWIVPVGSTAGAEALCLADGSVPEPAHGEVHVAMQA